MRTLLLLLLLALAGLLPSCTTTGGFLDGKTITATLGPDGNPSFGITFPTSK